MKFFVSKGLKLKHRTFSRILTDSYVFDSENLGAKLFTFVDISKENFSWRLPILQRLDV